MALAGWISTYITGNQISANTAITDGGFYQEYGNGLLQENQIFSNAATTSGGGLYILDSETGLIANANQIDFGDFDQDGDLDMVMAGGKPIDGVALFENATGLPARTVTRKLGHSEYCETAIYADFDTDGDIDGGDFLVWQGSFRSNDGGDADGDGDTDRHDLEIWETDFGTIAAGGQRASTVPEPASLALLLAASGIALTLRPIWHGRRGICSERPETSCNADTLTTGD